MGRSVAAVGATEALLTRPGLLVFALQLVLVPKAVAQSEQGVDLAVRDAAWLDAFGFRGRPLTVRFSVSNLGDIDAADFVVAAYLSPNPLINVTTDVNIGAFGPLAVSAGEVVERTTTATVPADLAPGAYYLGIVADMAGAIDDVDLVNNVARTSSTLVVRDPAPDFSATRVRVGAAAGQGEPLVVERVFVNAGNASGRLAYGVYLSADDRLGGSDVRLSTAAVDLGAGAERAGVDRPVVPRNVDPGSYRVIYGLDPEDFVDELDETNNVVVSLGAVTVFDAGGPSVRTQTLPDAVVQEAYRVRLSATGFVDQPRWRVFGSLPPGILLEDETLAGVPAQVGTWTFVVAANEAQRELRLRVIDSPAPLTVLTRAVPVAFVGEPYAFPLTAFGGVRPIEWSATGLPAGWQLDANGTVRARPLESTRTVVAVVVRDSAGSRAERQLTLRAVDVDDAVRLGPTFLPSGQLGVPYDASVPVAGGIPPYAIAHVEGGLPDGLQLQGGNLVGTPSRVGVYTFALRVTDAAGDFDVDRAVVEITEAQGIQILTTALPRAQTDVPYRNADGEPVRIRVARPAGLSVSLQVDGGRLPPGLVLSTGGTVTGTPTASGAYAWIVAAVDAGGQVDRRAFGVVVETEEANPPSSSGCRCANLLGPRRLASSAVASQAGSWPASGAALPTGRSKTGGSSGRARSAPWVVLLLGGVLLVLRRGSGWVLSLFIAMSVVGGRPAYAQSVAGYVSEWRNEGYRSRTGGSLLRFSEADDGFVAVELPFAFDFFGASHRRLVASSNGYVTFGNVGDAFANQALPSSEAPNDLIALMWDDLRGDIVSWHIEGQAPDRIAILQYELSLRRNRPASGRPRVQLWLYERGTGRFELRFGGVASMLDAPAWTASIGFEGPNGQRGASLLTCAERCDGDDLVGLNGRVWAAERDAGPSLRAESIGGSDRLDPGIPAPLQVQFRSLHAAPLGPFHWTASLVPAAGGPPAYTAGFGPVTLMGYQRQIATPTVAVPLTLAPGPYRWQLNVDATAAITEIDETDNLATATEQTTVAALAPDVLVDTMRVSGRTVAVGDAVTARAEVRNRGNRATQVGLHWVWSTNPVATPSDRVVRVQTAILEPFSAETIEASLSVPVDLASGTYFVGLIADPDDQVAELSEVNNAATSSAVLVAADDVVIAARAPVVGTVGRAYQHYLEAAGGTGVYTWRVVGGGLPDGLQLRATGEVVGRPIQVQQVTASIEVTSGAATAQADLTFAIVAPDAGLTILNRQLLPGVVGAEYPPSSAAPDGWSAVGGTPPRRWRLLSAPPPGLALLDSGRMVGTPTQPGVFAVAVSVTDATGASVERQLPLTVGVPGRVTVVADRLSPGVVDRPYRARLRTVGATTAVNFTAFDRPPGLSLRADGVLDGTPAEVGTFAFRVRATAATSEDEGQFLLSISADDGLTILPLSLPDAPVGVPFVADLVAVGGTPPFTWTVDGDPLPAGLSSQVIFGERTQSLRVSGTPTARGFAAIRVEVSDAERRTVDQPYALRSVEGAEPEESSGCRCTQRSSGAATWLLAGIAIAIVARRRR